MALPISGCEEESPFVGAWTGIDTGVGPSGFPGMKLVMSANGTYEAEISGAMLAGQWQATGDSVVIVPRVMNGQKVENMEGLGPQQLISPMTLRISEDKQTMVSTQTFIVLAGDLFFTREE